MDIKLFTFLSLITFVICDIVFLVLTNHEPSIAIITCPTMSAVTVLACACIYILLDVEEDEDSGIWDDRWYDE